MTGLERNSDIVYGFPWTTLYTIVNKVPDSLRLMRLSSGWVNSHISFSMSSNNDSMLPIINGYVSSVEQAD